MIAGHVRRVLRGPPAPAVQHRRHHSSSCWRCCYHYLAAPVQNGWVRPHLHHGGFFSRGWLHYFRHEDCHLRAGTTARPITPRGSRWTARPEGRLPAVVDNPAVRALTAGHLVLAACILTYFARCRRTSGNRSSLADDAGSSAWARPRRRRALSPVSAVCRHLHLLAVDVGADFRARSRR